MESILPRTNARAARIGGGVVAFTMLLLVGFGMILVAFVEEDDDIGVSGCIII